MNHNVSVLFLKTVQLFKVHELVGVRPRRLHIAFLSHERLAENAAPDPLIPSAEDLRDLLFFVADVVD